VLEIGDQAGVVPMIEVWGFSVNLSRLGDATWAAIESGHPRASILADVYHLHKGGSDARALRLLSANSMQVLHFNDYPADPPRDKITDAHRVYPGDGVAPLTDILRTLREIGFRGALSLELFNRDYWKQSPAKVAQTGIDKMRAAVQKALG
jgi:sugar phosphate isomerase/epimerase